MATTLTTTTYIISHDSKQTLGDLCELVEWVNAQLPNAEVRFESVKSDWGQVVVEYEASK